MELCTKAPLCDVNLSNLVYSCSPSTIPSTVFWPTPPVFSRSARLAILATHGVRVARVPWHPRPSACRRLRPRRFVCQLAPLHGWHSPGGSSPKSRESEAGLAVRQTQTALRPTRTCPCCSP